MFESGKSGEDKIPKSGISGEDKIQETGKIPESGISGEDNQIVKFDYKIKLPMNPMYRYNFVDKQEFPTNAVPCK